MGLIEAAVKTVTIANGAALSDGVAIGNGVVVALILPVLTNAAITFQASEDGVTYRDVYDSDGAEVTIPASAGDRYVQAPPALAGVPFIKVRSGTSGAPVNQGAQRLIGVVVK